MNKLPIIAKTCQLYFALVLVWILLEQLIYHEIQSRLVDDLISIPIMVIIYLMFDARTKLDVIKQTNEPENQDTTTTQNQTSDS